MHVSPKFPSKAGSAQVGNTPSVKTVGTHQQTQETEFREKADLEAQQDMAFWAMLMFFATLATVIVTAIGVWFVKRTLDATLKAVEDTSAATGAMREANEIARSVSKADRAWMVPTGLHINKVENSTLDGVFVENTLGFATKWVNSGRSPAVRSTVSRNGGIFEIGTPIDQQNVALTEPPLSEMSGIIGPNQSVSAPMVILTAEQVERFRRCEVFVVIVAKAFYFDVYSDTEDFQQCHVTEARYLVEHGGGTMLDPLGRETEAITITMVGCGEAT